MKFVCMLYNLVFAYKNEIRMVTGRGQAFHVPDTA